jgi:transcriptional regulator with XRE-family HTH domain
MNIAGMSNDAILAEIGERIKLMRLNRNISQMELAELAGVTRIVIRRLENGRGCTIESLIRILRPLDSINRIDAFLPEPGISPIQLAKLGGNERVRASHPHHSDKS